MGTRAIGIALLITLPALGHAENFDVSGTSLQGRLRFVMVGASLVDNHGLENGVNCLRERATATVAVSDLPLRPKLVKATLYLGGSLIADDGIDFANPDRELFVTPGLSADVPAQRPLVEQAAQAAADTAVDLLLPGASETVSVAAVGGNANVAVYYKPGGAEAGNVGFFVTPIDVTEILNDSGAPLAGDYTVSGLQADVCRGLEVTCDGDPSTASCATMPGSAPHTNGAASFALLLLVEDPSLPLHAVTVFDGLVSLAGTTLTLNLNLTNPVSAPAVGGLAFYALEGDRLLPTVAVNDGPCAAEEFIEVDGDVSPGAAGVCLQDDDNPLGNIFNSTINVAPAAVTPGCDALAQNNFNCCLGDGLCDVTGVDIDNFDISNALVPGADRLRVTLGTGLDRIALAAVVVGVDVFEPVLNLDSQYRVFEAADSEPRRIDDAIIRVGSDVIYSLAVSNTGNVPARQVRVTLPAPVNSLGFSATSTPPGASISATSTGGTYGNGQVVVSGFDVAAGEIAEVRVRAQLGCEPPRRTLTAQAVISSVELLPFTVLAPTLTVGGPGVRSCAGLDPDGPFKLPPEPRDLRGGAATCNSGIGSWILGAWVALAIWRRQRGAASLMLLACVVVSGACGKEHDRTATLDAPDLAIVDVSSLPGEPCGNALRVYVTHADGSRFCIDRFEAGHTGTTLGNPQQSATDEERATDGSTQAAATITLGLPPAANISWYQAKALCENAGKRLCARAEWERACRGPDALIYPYGDTIDDHACQGFFAYPALTPEVTGSLSTCGSAFGVYDLSGNLEEWVADSVPRVPGTTVQNDRQVRGGSYKSNSNALACVGDEFHEAPGSADSDRGFRCCSDGAL